MILEDVLKKSARFKDFSLLLGPSFPVARVWLRAVRNAALSELIFSHFLQS